MGAILASRKAKEAKVTGPCGTVRFEKSSNVNELWPKSHTVIA